jgi:hypothetical protein
MILRDRAAQKARAICVDDRNEAADVVVEGGITMSPLGTEDLPRW